MSTSPSSFRSTLTIIVVTYNNQAVLANCLASLEDNAPFIEGLIIVDNASCDQTLAIVEKLKKNAPFNIKVLKNRRNFGFAKAVNQGVRLAEKKFPKSNAFFLLNPDAQLASNCFKQLLQEDYYNPQIGLLSPAIFQDSSLKTPWFVGGHFNWLKLKTIHTKSSSKKQYLTGCALLIKKELLQKIGYFDEHFFLYYEDADLSLRAQQAGYSLRLIPAAICYHQESRSFPSLFAKNYHLAKSGLLFFYKHYPRWALPYFWSYFWIRFTYHRFFSHKKSVLQAMQDFLQEYKVISA